MNLTKDIKILHLGFKLHNFDCPDGSDDVSDKSTGSFYTPENLVQYMINYIKGRVSFTRVLEPSVGDGRFIDGLRAYSQNILAIEIDQEKVRSLTPIICNNVRIECADFTEYALKHDERFTLVIGNPPYISKKSMDEGQRERSIKLLKLFKQHESLFQNLWVSFILGSLKLLSNDGSIFFVLPFEFLQVQYAEKLRIFLEDKFNTIEITTFEERVFSETEQDVCLVFMCNEKSSKPYVKYTTIKSIDNPKIVFESVIMRNKPLKKWSNCILNDDETESLNKISKQYPKIKEFGEISPGIVTGANSFFVVDHQMISKLGLYDTAIRVISKSNYVKGIFLFTTEDFCNLSNTKKRVYLINLRDIEEDTFSENLREYLSKGKMDKISERYKCQKRYRWFDVPIVKTGLVCFFKRYHLYPRLLINNAGVHTTDIAYNIRFYHQYDHESFAFCFYNSLTLALCEYYGRFYGGGVGELVPSEFKELFIPYQKVDRKHILHVDKMIRENKPFYSVVDYVDGIVLKLSSQEKEAIQDIRNRFIRRRLNKDIEEV